MYLGGGILLVYWVYPYILIGNSFVPLALFASIVVFLGLFFYKFYAIKCKQYIMISIKNRYTLIINIMKQITWATLLFAFAEIDPEFSLYRFIQDSTITIRQIDTFAYVLFIIFLAGGVQYRNAYSYIVKLSNYLIKINQIEILVIIFQRFPEGDKGFLSLKMQILFVLFYTIINIRLYLFSFGVRENKKVSNSDNDKTESLYDLRKIQMDEILKRLKAYSQKQQLTIFVSDEWGGGKTFFAKDLCSRLKCEHYNTVWIDLVDFNDEEAFIKQVLKRIRIELELNNYYTGKHSEFEKYLKAILDISTNETIANLFVGEKILFNENSVKINSSMEGITKQLSQMLGEKKIVIIIDDLDRCTKETVKYAMKLFSEIIRLPKSIIIFVGDYKQLISEPDINKGFFDKYFMYNYNLCKMPYDYLLDYYSEIYEFNGFKLPEFFDIPQYINKIIQDVSIFCSQELNILPRNNVVQSGLSEAAIREATLLEENLKKGLTQLKDRLSNPRRIIRIYNEIYDQLNRINMTINLYLFDKNKVSLIFQDKVYPAIMFYGLVRTLCIDIFWDICTRDFEDFHENILDVLRKMNTENISATNDEEGAVYGVLIYYYFSSDFNRDNDRGNEFKKFYIASNFEEYLCNEVG